VRVPSELEDRSIRGGPRKLPKLAVARRPGPCWVRTASGTAGPRRARAVNVGESTSHVTGRSPSRPWTAKQPGAGFESHLSRRRASSSRRQSERLVSGGGPLGYHHAGDQGQPVYIGGCPWPRPARAPPSKAVAGRDRLSGAAGGGSALPWQGPLTRGAAAPASGVPGPRLVHTPSEPSGSQRSPAVSGGRSFAQVAGAILRTQARGRTLIRMRSPRCSERSCHASPKSLRALYVGGRGSSTVEVAARRRPYTSGRSWRSSRIRLQILVPSARM
jgi:hypothetical protein